MGSPEGNMLLGIPQRRFEDNIKIDLFLDNYSSGSGQG
jgi:hypothetical protein